MERLYDNMQEENKGYLALYMLIAKFLGDFVETGEGEDYDGNGRLQCREYDTDALFTAAYRKNISRTLVSPEKMAAK
jgi:hypothetical protein